MEMKLNTDNSLTLKLSMWSPEKIRENVSRNRENVSVTSKYLMEKF